MNDASRREFLRATVGVSLLTAGSATAALPAADVNGLAPAFDRAHVPVPLPFRTGALQGLSAPLMQSHWENNYGGAVKALNLIRGRLRQALADSGTPPYMYNGFKREQQLRTGSVVLHELYFGNLGGDGKAGAELRASLAAAFGSFDAWEAEFRKIGLGLGGGSGWVVLGYNRRLQLLENYGMADHAAAPVDTTPLLVMDMYEHAYHMDYGAAAARYIDAFFVNLNWDAVASRMPPRSGSERTGA